MECPACGNRDAERLEYFGSVSLASTKESEEPAVEISCLRCGHQWPDDEVYLENKKAPVWSEA